jgi:hypothetical protein
MVRNPGRWLECYAVNGQERQWSIFRLGDLHGDAGGWLLWDINLSSNGPSQLISPSLTTMVLYYQKIEDMSACKIPLTCASGTDPMDIPPSRARGGPAPRKEF